MLIWLYGGKNILEMYIISDQRKKSICLVFKNKALIISVTYWNRLFFFGNDIAICRPSHNQIKMTSIKLGFDLSQFPQFSFHPYHFTTILSNCLNVFIQKAHNTVTPLVAIETFIMWFHLDCLMGMACFCFLPFLYQSRDSQIRILILTGRCMWGLPQDLSYYWNI